MQRPSPYCTPQMLAMLNQFAEGTPVGSGRNPGKAIAHLKSRGWVKEDRITPAGRTYLETKR